LGITDRVVFAGQQTDPRPYLQAADIFMLPSRQEGFSNALLEAMASGLPVVATDVGGNSEAVVNGDGGWIVRPEDAEALANAVQSLATQRTDLPAMGRRNRERVEKTFSLDRSVVALASWYRYGDLAH
jgi:glycosyltransferase involved in cell wall biosynthesis